MSPTRSPFEGLRSPSVPAGLRERVLSAARGTAAAEALGLVYRLWESRWAPLAAAAVLFGLLMLNLAIPPRSLPGADRPALGGGAAGLMVDGIPLPDPGETAAEQWKGLAPAIMVDGDGAGETGGRE